MIFSFTSQFLGDKNKKRQTEDRLLPCTVWPVFDGYPLPYLSQRMNENYSCYFFDVQYYIFKEKLLFAYMLWLWTFKARYLHKIHTFPFLKIKSKKRIVLSLSFKGEREKNFRLSLTEGQCTLTTHGGKKQSCGCGVMWQSKISNCGFTVHYSFLCRLIEREKERESCETSLPGTTEAYHHILSAQFPPLTPVNVGLLSSRDTLGCPRRPTQYESRHILFVFKSHNVVRK